MDRDECHCQQAKASSEQPMALDILDKWVLLVDRGPNDNTGVSYVDAVHKGPSKGIFEPKNLAGLSLEGELEIALLTPCPLRARTTGPNTNSGSKTPDGGDSNADDEEDDLEDEDDSDYDMDVDVVSAPKNTVIPIPVAIPTSTNAPLPLPLNVNSTIVPSGNTAPPSAAIVPPAAIPQPAISPLFFEFHGGEYDTPTVDNFRRIPERDLHPDLQGRVVKTTVRCTPDQLVTQMRNYSRPWAEALNADDGRHRVDVNSLSDEARESISGPIPHDFSVYELLINPLHK